mmetsp:Transcript_13087/g.17720  ORF Transcript_13087/g.17720 Transcript_13087/m.17720 type:complete len:141 (+) Transcript_13087:997-1419(+)|eukprot:CAMPEP_0185572404 /NCGR_PEP_ID=MMETSP0434-20130131/4340_1 /TAXON_ID=626734 ORGANISM="Favella taraikaensis, Strain Fe Narragansett Bay" /NCGR_SAMPLE_ID=MMETSP0434 /ASSEMBLY_ACC=CAM_ASM_000379 /LENGTH=140 /DNA_ID=CAMNT_0028188269 /DNA_START=899 /DNA_END=1321 /DNA_ORIENTATION=+
MARKAIIVWQSIDPASSERVFHAIDSAMQRALLEEEQKFALHLVLADGSLQFKAHLQHNSADIISPKRIPSSHGKAQGSPKMHALASPKRSRAAAGSPKPNKASSKLGDSGVRTVSRGKPRPGSAAATGSAMRAAKGGSA